ncbi:MAG TPA: hypothetical protein VMW17_15455 [Candidatus Binatia bacterium]|nr:hypothetical protein [Candidatus Binatia bacterium]
MGLIRPLFDLAGVEIPSCADDELADALIATADEQSALWFREDHLRAAGARLARLECANRSNNGVPSPHHRVHLRVM